MGNNDAGKFRSCWMFDTHHTVYHLDQDNNIVWIHCHEVQDDVIGIISEKTAAGYLWNPGVFALQNAQDEKEIWDICAELSTTYSQRILSWLDGTKQYWLKRAA